MNVLAQMNKSKHEQVVFVQDLDAGLRAIIAIHNTTLGNNQIASPSAARMLSDRGILYAPDYVINAGGLMNVWVELQGYDPGRALTLAGSIDANLRKR